MLVILFIIIVYVLSFVLIYDMYEILQHISRENLLFPAWFTWMMLLPIVGYIFAWIMMPFGFPKSLEREFRDNVAIQKLANRLFMLGLALVVLFSCMVIFHFLFGVIFPIIIVLLVIYFLDVKKVKHLLIQPR